MADFAAGALDLLVATTVIVEVGVDVPNASLMIIESPERLCLSQLHQLRGRVGRGSARSHCVLLYHVPLSPQARARLAILRESSDGFEIACKDLQLRGAGEVLGTRQTGGVQFRVADPVGDEKLLPAARQTADLILERHPGHVRPLIVLRDRIARLTRPTPKARSARAGHADRAFGVSCVKRGTSGSSSAASGRPPRPRRHS